MTGLIYVASPYSDPDKQVVQLRMNKFAGIMAKLIEHKFHPVSPLLNHYLADVVTVNFPLTWDWWQDYSRLLLSKCDHMIVIGPDWEKSTGTMAEIEIATELSIPISYLTTYKDIENFINPVVD
ncbi:MAG: DUF1937 family protein [Gammaproteobacteria bacterium]|nr:DUF1937 family protein [Gammaproteobacteria bacterium]